MVSVEASLAEAHGRLDADPAAAEALARDVLAAHPGHPGARFLQACAWLAQGQAEAATTAFQASRLLVSNGEFLAFVEAGGYRDETLWSEEGLAWKN